MVRSELKSLWRSKELERGEIITVQEVAEKTGLHWQTVRNMKSGSTRRFDENVIAKICDYFDVEPGQPVPFLVYERA